MTNLKNFFLTPLVVRAYFAHELSKGERQLYIVLEDLVYSSEKYGTITVPKSTITDFASIPRCALWYVDDDDPCILYPSVLHDWLYSVRSLPRATADEILREAMIASGARPAQAAVVYRAVRMFGGSHWPQPVTPSP